MITVTFYSGRRKRAEFTFKTIYGLSAFMSHMGADCVGGFNRFEISDGVKVLRS